MIRAKVECEWVQGTKSQESVKFRAVTSDSSPENKIWSMYTPALDLTITISNPALRGKFEPGKFYYLDFTEVT